MELITFVLKDYSNLLFLSNSDQFLKPGLQCYISVIPHVHFPFKSIQDAIPSFFFFNFFFPFFFLEGFIAVGILFLFFSFDV